MATMERFIYASPVPIVPIPIDLDISTDTASKKIDINWFTLYLSIYIINYIIIL